MSGPYDDILHLPHHVSATHARMSAQDRAAQFSPFAALTGYEAAVEETARLTDQQIELAVDATADLNKKLALIQERIADGPQVTLTYFVQDQRKSGGAYVTAAGRVRKIDGHEKYLLLADGTRIFFADILSIGGDWPATGETHCF